jgi:tryptophan aminotransferase
VTTTLERRKEVLALAHEHNFLIMEGERYNFAGLLQASDLNPSSPDDPYYYLYFGSAARPPSYWELEGQGDKPCGRVLRFDSFSKVISAGLRIGMVTGPKALVDAINMHVSTHRADSA